MKDNKKALIEESKNINTSIISENQSESNVHENMPENNAKNQQKNISCNIFFEQWNVINQLPLKDRYKVLYLAVGNAFKDIGINQNDNQNENQFENTYISISISLSKSLSNISKSILELLKKTITCKVYSSNYGGKREGAGRKKPQNTTLEATTERFKKPQGATTKERKEYINRDSKNFLINLSKEKNLNQDWINLISVWLDYKKGLNQSYKTEQSLSAFIQKLLNLSNNNLEVATAIINESMANNWKGIFSLKNKLQIQEGGTDEYNPNL